MDRNGRMDGFGAMWEEKVEKLSEGHAASWAGFCRDVSQILKPI